MYEKDKKQIASVSYRASGCFAVSDGGLLGKSGRDCRPDGFSFRHCKGNGFFEHGGYSDRGGGTNRARISTPLKLTNPPEGYDANDKAAAADLLDLVFEDEEAKDQSAGAAGADAHQRSDR